MTSFCENVHCFWKNLCLNEHNVLHLALILTARTASVSGCSQVRNCSVGKWCCRNVTQELVIQNCHHVLNSMVRTAAYPGLPHSASHFFTELNVEPLLGIERSQPRWFGHVARSVSEKIGESRPTSCTHGKAAQRSTGDQAA